MSIFKRYFNKKQYDTEQTVTWSEESAVSNTKGMFWKRFKRHKLAVIGLWFLAIITMAAILAPVFAPFDPAEITGEFSAPPSLQHLLGTDQVGRDVLSRVIYAARVSLAVGIGAVAISAIIGTVLGLISGYFGGMIDGIVMRITDMFMSFPYILFILVVASIVGPGLTNIILILGVLGWPGIARLVRGNVLAIKQSDYVKASIALGYSTPRILFKHILPNTVAPILIYATSGVAGAILDEAALSFLGLGVQPPDASWGNMLSNAQSISILTDQPWLWIPPGILILLTVLAINYIGDALRDALDPHNSK
ncbi:peptide ABC transporter permease [Lysinibacillus sphaericus]|uniref:Glutathione transport system permease protein GsiD n=2 Tax=Lysinibacillus sphaericus TaxID=1421 RepID=A0A2S5D047_LYSSH|nr:oligopeptide ABC transporter permease [Lysinibacillus sphaericus]OEC01328.1 peptide ABC transporter permease [Lysinibacillus sphaericus]POZ56368.1 Glutathione transport system permease protein GsiD [Lysinibacillus sphaericus]